MRDEVIRVTYLFSIMHWMTRLTKHISFG